MTPPKDTTSPLRPDLESVVVGRDAVTLQDRRSDEGGEIGTVFSDGEVERIRLATRLSYESFREGLRPFKPKAR